MRQALKQSMHAALASAWRVLPAAGLMLAFFLLPDASAEQSVFAATLWVVTLLGSYLGLGWLVQRVLDTHVDVGLRLCWGMGAHLLLGGWLLLLGVSSRFTLEAQVLAGLAVLLWSILTTPRAASAASWSLAALLPLAAVVLLYVVNTGYRSYYLDCDDHGAYLGLATKILQRGDFQDPFSVRRMSAWGGHTWLQAQLLLRVNLGKVHMLDMGLSLAACVALVVGAGWNRGRAALLAATVAALVLLGVTLTRVSTASVGTSIALALALVRTLALPISRPERVVHHAAAVALVGGALCTMKGHQPPYVVACVAASMAWRLLAREPGGRVWIRHVAWTAVFAVITVLPWAAMAVLSNATPHLLLAKGNYNVQAPLFASSPSWAGWWARWQAALGAGVLFPKHTLWWVSLALLLPEDNPGKPLRSAVLAGLLTSAATVYNFPAAVWMDVYLAPFFVPLLPLSILALPSLVETPTHRRLRALLPAAGVLVCALLWVTQQRTEVWGRITGTLRQLAAGTRGTVTAPPEAYVRLGNAVPHGARVLTMVNAYAWFNHANAEYWSLDQPGVASPAPGLPWDRDEAAWLEYLHALGITHIAWVKANAGTCLYAPVRPGQPPKDELAQWIARHMEQARAMFEAIQRQGGVVYEDAQHVLVALPGVGASPAPPP